MSKTEFRILKNHIPAVRSVIKGNALLEVVMAGGFVLSNQIKIKINTTFSSKALGGGGLQGSVMVLPDKVSEKRASVDVGPTKIYGRIHELGGVILPVYAKMLSWIGDGGIRIFARAVHMPARPFMRPAFDENIDKIYDAMKLVIKEKIEKELS